MAKNLIFGGWDNKTFFESEVAKTFWGWERKKIGEGVRRQKYF